MIILIPAFEPGDSLVRIVRELRDDSPWSIVLVVDDGSGPAYAPVFAAASAQGAEVIGYDHNRGKGFALKTGFRHVLAHYPDEAVVTADSDGQHRVTDIVRVAEHLSSRDHSEPAIVLGGRRFAGNVPLRSRFGNSVSRVAFRLAAGLSIGDTQTGLRGFSSGTLPWLLTVEGDRFEYETRMLLATREAGIALEELEIDTVYLEHNASSHFRPIVDSVRVMRPLLTFAVVSLGSFLLDLVVLEVIFALSGSLVFSVVGARVVSGTANFLANRRAVFARSRVGIRRQALRYVGLALALLAASYASIALLTAVGAPLLAAKITTDITLYIASYLVQRRFVFARAKRVLAAPTPRELVASER
jgi:glycosyltransferase involved in cell wall biosynthesis